MEKPVKNNAPIVFFWVAIITMFVLILLGEIFRQRSVITMQHYLLAQDSIKIEQLSYRVSYDSAKYQTVVDAYVECGKENDSLMRR
jgi:hypothetical protein